MFERVLVANRGEIAVRIIRSLRELGLGVVTVHSEVDADCLHVRLGDSSVCIGPAPSAQSYLRIDAILGAAIDSGAGAIHPGYGFLAESAAFAEACEQRGLVFIGPTAENIRMAGDKLSARRSMADAGLPVVPGSRSAVQDLDQARRICNEVGFPVVLKATAGGGGRGMRMIEKEQALAEGFMIARGEAAAAFGDSTLYVEKRIDDARHIEVQVLGDGHGQAIHLGERNCSVQRRHQKIVEEGPSPALPDPLRDKLHRAAVDGVAALGYRNAGTVEFLVDPDERCYFLELNSRIQVEHPVTELITGLDLIKAQLRVETDDRLPFAQEQVRFRGHAIECRINAEDPDDEFMPQPGVIESFRPPAGYGVRLDTHVYAGYEIPIYYDSLLGKLLAHGTDRDEAIAVMSRALDEFEIGPGRTTIPLLRRIMDEPAFRDGSYTTRLLGQMFGVSEEP